jgi:type III pantothenate kinase
MNLLIDSGNTSLKAAIFEKGQLKELFQGIDMNTLDSIIKNHMVNKAIISSVNQDAKDIAEKINLKNTFILDQNTKLPFKNLYKTPATLGTDRLAAVAGAITKFPGHPCLAIDAGTCITLDFIDKDLNYRGGSIAPGIELRFKAMHNFTARLPLVERNQGALSLIGANTEESMQSGVMNGVIAEMDGMIRIQAAISCSSGNNLRRRCSFL